MRRCGPTPCTSATSYVRLWNGPGACATSVGTGIASIDAIERTLRTSRSKKPGLRQAMTAPQSPSPSMPLISHGTKIQRSPNETLVGSSPCPRCSRGRPGASRRIFGDACQSSWLGSARFLRAREDAIFWRFPSWPTALGPTAHSLGLVPSGFRAVTQNDIGGGHLTCPITLGRKSPCR